MMHAYSSPHEPDESAMSLAIGDEESTPYQVSRRRTARLIRGLSLLSLILFIIIIILSIFVSKYHNDLQQQNQSTNNIQPTSMPPTLSPPTNAPTSAPNNSYSQLIQQIKDDMDTTIHPCTDFYQYACGGWLKTNTIPPDQTRWTRTFNIIADRNNEALNNIAEQDWPVIGTFYKSCMNTAQLDSLKVEPIQRYLDAAMSVSNITEVMQVSAMLVRELGTSPFMSIGVGVDSKIPEQYLLSIGQGGRTFSLLEYYNGPDNKTASLVTNITYIFTLLGDNETYASSQAHALVEFEQAIVGFTLPPDKLRDPEQTYNKFNLTGLNQTAPLPWDIYFSSLGFALPPNFTLNVEVRKFAQGISTLLNNTNMDTIRAYLKWRIVYATSPSLSSEFANAHFEYFMKYISGQDKPAPRWKKCATMTNNYLPDIMGRYYIQSNFPGESKNKTREMVKQLKQAFVKNLSQLRWMDRNTTLAAEQKLSQMVDLIGYPSSWTDYSSVHILSSYYLRNQIVLNQLDWDTNTVQRLNQTVDKNIWQMSPPTVNAYYDPTLNTINFPAGIIQPTFFDVNYPAAMNFGGIGMVMGHELTHGFDDEGRQYDGTGRLHGWWPDGVVKAFKERANCFADQYSKFEVKGLNESVNGNLTLGENIADNGGIRQSYVAFQTQHGTDPRIDPHFSNQQLFFLAYAQSWCTLINPQKQFELLKSDPHSPAFARVNGPLQNFDKFAEAFQCPEDSYMNPTKKCVLW